jgi:hypothetical protein
VAGTPTPRPGCACARTPCPTGYVRAEEALPGPLVDNRLDVEVALLVSDQLKRHLLGN